MIQHQADSLEAHQDPPTSATTRRESQRSSLKIIAEALNRQQQQRRGRRHLSPQPILTPLSTSSVGEMHQSQRSNNDNNDRGEETTKEEEERQLPRQRRQHNDIKKEEGKKDNKTETTTTKKEEGKEKEKKTKKEERKVKEEEEGKGEEDRRRRRRQSSQPRRWTTTTTIMTTTFLLFLFIFCFVFICHLPRPLSESTGSTRERVGATSSSTNNLSDIKQRLVNSIEILLDNNNKVDVDIDNKERQQQDSDNMASADQPSTTQQTAAQATVEPTMVPSSAGTSATADLPRLNTVTINENNILRQLNAITINLKLRDNMLYQTSSPTLLNFYDQFSSVVFLGNSTPINRDDVPIIKHISDFINNMKPAQRSSSTTTSSEWFIVLTEEEHLYYQQHQHLQQRPLTHHQQQRPRLHSDSVSAINYIIYVASTAATTSSTYLPNVPNDATLYLYSFILNPASATTWQRYNRRAGYQELEPSTGTTISPTTNWGFLNMVVEGATASTLSFIRDSNFQQQHLIDYNLISSPTQCHVASIIAMIQHPAIRNRIRGWLNQYHHGIYGEFFNNNGDIRNKWLQQDPTTSGNVWSRTRSNDGSSNIWASGCNISISISTSSVSLSQPASIVNNSIGIWHVHHHQQRPSRDIVRHQVQEVQRRQRRRAHGQHQRLSSYNNNKMMCQTQTSSTATMGSGPTEHHLEQHQH